MLNKVLEGCQRQNDAPRRGVLAYDRPPRKTFKHTFLLCHKFYIDLSTKLFKFDIINS
jgi:hypothetical protein